MIYIYFSLSRRSHLTVVYVGLSQVYWSFSPTIDGSAFLHQNLTASEHSSGILI